MPRSRRLRALAAALLSTATLISAVGVGAAAARADTSVVISGTLVDAYKHKPLVGWTVYDDKVAGSSVTSSKGRFSFTTVQYGGKTEKHSLVAYKGGDTTAAATVVLPSGRPTIALGTVVTKQLPSVSGRVVGQTGKGLKWAHVQLLKTNGQPVTHVGGGSGDTRVPIRTDTASNGTFRLAGLPSGTYRLAVSLDGTGLYDSQNQMNLASFFVGAHGNVATSSTGKNIVIRASTSKAPVASYRATLRATTGAHATFSYTGITGSEGLIPFLTAASSVDAPYNRAQLQSFPNPAPDDNGYVTGRVVMTAILPGRYVLSQTGYSRAAGDYVRYYFTGTGKPVSTSRSKAAIITIKAGVSKPDLGTFVVKK